VGEASTSARRKRKHANEGAEKVPDTLSFLFELWLEFETGTRDTTLVSRLFDGRKRMSLPDGRCHAKVETRLRDRCISFSHCPIRTASMPICQYKCLFMIRTATAPCRGDIRRKIQVRAAILFASVRPSLLLCLPPYSLRNAPKPSFLACELDLRGRGWRTFGFVVTADGGASMPGAAEWGAHGRRPVDHLL
jgi:hypothetical protein